MKPCCSHLWTFTRARALLVAAGIVLAACASAPPPAPVTAQAVVGMEAYHAGRYDLAQYYLGHALTALPLSEAQSNPATLPWRQALAHTYWETGQDQRLLNFVRVMLPTPESQRWVCRVQEREGYSALAARCYHAIGDPQGEARAMRSATLTHVFAKDNTRFGVPQP